jgi:hypothetical protein
MNSETPSLKKKFLADWESIISAAEQRLGCSLLKEGVPPPISAGRRCLLISRGERTPQPDAPWFCSMLTGLQRSLLSGEILVTGANRLCFDAAANFYSRRGGVVVTVLDRPADDARRLSPETLWPPNAFLIFPAAPSPKTAAERHAALARRDSLIAELSDRAWKIRLRADGNMAKALERLTRRGAMIETPPGLSAEEKSNRKKSKPDQADWRRMADFGDKTMLFHFTRAPEGPWPGEKRNDFLIWLTAAINPRTDLDALIRIISEMSLRAGTRLSPAKIPLVSFTEASPRELAEAAIWRKGLARWTFRPYGLAVQKEVLCKVFNARKVNYLDDSLLKRLTPEERLYAQPKTWAAEREWRVKGDVNLALLPEDAWRPFVLNNLDLNSLPLRIARKTMPLSEF